MAFPPRLTVTADASALRQAAVVLFVVPAQSMRANVQAVAGHLDGGAILVSASKGLEIGSAWRMSEVIAQEVTRAAGTAEGADGVARRVAALSGPNLAREIAAGKAASTVVACPDEQAAARVQEALMAPHFRVYTSTDVTGVELGGALKNVIALGAGMADGLQAGDNGKAALMTRGLAEIARLGKAAGAEPLTFSGLAGLGDLIATCMSGLSRNRTLGEALARGASLERGPGRDGAGHGRGDDDRRRPAAGPALQCRDADHGLDAPRPVRGALAGRSGPGPDAARPQAGAGRLPVAWNACCTALPEAPDTP